MEHRLYRSRRDRMVAGVAGGLGAYFGLDPLIVRVAFIVLAITPGIGWLLYLVLWLVVPEEPQELVSLELMPRYHRLDARERGMLAGGVLIVLGLLLLAQEFGLWWWASLRHLWPLALIVVGVALLIDRTRGGR